MLKKGIALLTALSLMPMCYTVWGADEIVLTVPSAAVGENVVAKYFEPAVERFNEQNAGIYRIEVEEVVEAEFSDKMTQLAQAGKLPTLFPNTVTVDWTETVLIPNNLYQPMNEFLDAHPEIKELCLDHSMELCTQENGDIVSVPVTSISTVGLFYNSALYSPEKNVGDMTVAEFAESLGENKMAFDTGDNAWCTMLFWTSLIANEEGGKELLMESYGGKITDFNQAPILNASKKLQEIWQSNAADNAVGAAYADAANAFMSNQAAVICNGPWMNAEFSAENGGDKWSGEFDGANVKADYYPGNIAIDSSRGYGGWIMTTNGTDEEKECAEAFLAFLYSKEELETQAMILGQQIPNMEYSEAFYANLETDPLAKAQTELATAETTIVPAMEIIMVDSVAYEVLGNAIVQMVNGDITPEEFCQTLTTKSMEATEE